MQKIHVIHQTEKQFMFLCVSISDKNLQTTSKTTYVISFLNLREMVNNILHNSKETETETERNKLGALMME